MSEHWNSEEGKNTQSPPEDEPENQFPSPGEDEISLTDQRNKDNSSPAISLPPHDNNIQPKINNLFRWLLLGLLLLFLIGHWENKHLQKSPGSRGIILWDKEILDEITHKIPEESKVEQILVIPNVNYLESKENPIIQILKKIELDEEKSIPSLSYPAFISVGPIEEFLPVLASGRLPEPGKKEALAGDLAPLEPFTIGDETYTVVGVLSRECAPFVGAYIIPLEDVTIKKIDNLTVGLFFPDNQVLFSILRSLGEEKLKNTDWTQNISGLQIRTSLLFAISTALALLIICFSFRDIIALFYSRLANPPTPLLGPLFTEISNRKKLFRFINTFLYAVFFINLFTALYEPETHRLLIHYINHVFSEGDLQYIGKAYEEGNILQAAINTFHNNFWVQTFLLTIIISIPPFLLGVLKSIASFTFAGYAMSPIWTGTAVRLTFHSLTIVMELEAYILAVFAVILWTYYFWNVIFTRKQCLIKLSQGFRVLVSATLASACLLAIAALYEAITIILLSGSIN